MSRDGPQDMMAGMTEMTGATEMTEWQQ